MWQHPIKSQWSDDDRVDLLKRLWAAGWSASKISREMDCTRSAVLGKVNRLGLIGTRSREATAKNNKAPRPLASRALMNPPYRPPPVRPLPPTPPNAPTSLDIMFSDLRKNQCKFAYGTSHPYLFCGHDTYGGSWCPFHHKATQVPVEPRRVNHGWIPA